MSFFLRVQRKKCHAKRPGMKKSLTWARVLNHIMLLVSKILKDVRT